MKALASVREEFNHLLWHVRGLTYRWREQAGPERVGRVERERRSSDAFISVQHALLDRDAWCTTTALSLPLSLEPAGYRGTCPLTEAPIPRLYGLDVRTKPCTLTGKIYFGICGMQRHKTEIKYSDKGTALSSFEKCTATTVPSHLVHCSTDR